MMRRKNRKALKLSSKTRGDQEQVEHFMTPFHDSGFALGGWKANLVHFTFIAVCVVMVTRGHFLGKYGWRMLLKLKLFNLN